MQGRSVFCAVKNLNPKRKRGRVVAFRKIPRLRVGLG